MERPLFALRHGRWRGLRLLVLRSGEAGHRGCFTVLVAGKESRPAPRGGPLCPAPRTASPATRTDRRSARSVKNCKKRSTPKSPKTTTARRRTTVDGSGGGSRPERQDLSVAQRSRSNGDHGIEAGDRHDPSDLRRALDHADPASLDSDAEQRIEERRIDEIAISQINREIVAGHTR